MWERIRTSADPDPLEVLQVAAAFSGYFDASGPEGSNLVCALGWAVVGADCRVPRSEPTNPVAACERTASLQALLAASGKRRWEAVKRDPITWYGETKAFPA